MTLIMFFEFLIGLADVYIAGKIGKEVQAAYGFVFQIYFVFTIIANSFTVGSVSTISRLFTSGRKDELGIAVFSSILTAMGGGVIFGVGATIFGARIIDVLNVPEEIKVLGKPLITIYSAGLLFHYILINSNGILRSCKSVRKSLATMAFICSLNILLNFYFVFYTPIGFRGIALSTALSVFIGSIVNIFHISKLTAGIRQFSLVIVKKIIGIGWPIGLLQVAWQGGAVIIYLILSMLPENKIEILAAFTNGQRIESAIFLPAFAFNMANAVVVGNLLGKGIKDDAFHNGIVTAALGTVIITVLAMLVVFNARIIAPLLSNNSIVIAESIRYLYISLICEPVMVWSVILGGGLNGSGDTKGVMAIVAMSIWLVRLPLSYIFGILLGLGAAGVWWSMNTSLVVQMIFVTRRYLKRGWFKYA